MNKRTFHCDLSPESIRKAASDLRQYRQELPRKLEELRRCARWLRNRDC